MSPVYYLLPPIIKFASFFHFYCRILKNPHSPHLTSYLLSITLIINLFQSSLTPQLPYSHPLT
ncbi:hypothetical protein C4H12_12335 [Capnocytophaga sp. oral taxon 878]|nr:hypothetical protein C4H12_12335 [Capnocytophaga sp. oral taxon 878]